MAEDKDKDLTVDDHDERIREVLTRAYVQGNWEPVYDRTPLQELMEKEAEVELSRSPVRESYCWPDGQEDGPLDIHYLKQEEARAVADYTRERLMQWLSGDGLHPFPILQRYYALASARYPDIVGPLNGAWLAKILGQGRAAFSALMMRLFNIPVEAKMGVRVAVGNQKKADSREKYAANAKKHQPRRYMQGGGLGEGEAQSRRDQMTQEQSRRVNEIRRQAQLKQEREDREFFERFKTQAKEQGNNVNHVQDHE